MENTTLENIETSFQGCLYSKRYDLFLYSEDERLSFTGRFKLDLEALKGQVEHGSSYFSKKEFKDKESLTLLVELIQTDLPKYSSFPLESHNIDSQNIKWLNIMLEKDNWFDNLLVSKKIDVDQFEELKKAVEECNKACFDKKSKSGKRSIRRRNRLLLEIAYLGKCPKSREYLFEKVSVAEICCFKRNQKSDGKVSPGFKIKTDIVIKERHSVDKTSVKRYEVKEFLCTDFPELTPSDTIQINGLEYYPVSRLRKVSPSQNSINTQEENQSGSENPCDLSNYKLEMLHDYIYDLCDLSKILRYCCRRDKLDKLGSDHKINVSNRLRIKYLKPSKDGSRNESIFRLYNPLNPVEALSNKRLVVYKGLSDRAPIAHRDVDRSFLGKIGLFETPETDKIGLSQFLAVSADVDEDGFFKFPAGEAESGNTEKNTKNKGIAPIQYLSYASNLIPFVNHNDGPRITMGGKNLKQALPLLKSEVPMICTGFETIIPEKLSSGDRKRFKKIGFIRSSILDNEESGKNKDTLCLGVNLLCGYIPWKGYNFEDGIVISTTVKEKLVSIHRVIKRIDLCRNDYLYINEQEFNFEDFKDENTELTKPRIKNQEVKGEKSVIHKQKLGDVYLARKINNRDQFNGTIKDFEAHTITGNNIRITLFIEQKREVEVGDKLMGRHGNKGVITRIEKENNMPLTFNGQRIEILLNPHSVLSRKNLGQLIETQYTMAAGYLGEEKSDRRPIHENFNNSTAMKLAGIYQDLSKRYPGKITDDGRVRVTGTCFRNGKAYITCGYQYFVKLNHRAADKCYARSTGYYRPDTGQPPKGKARGGGLRIGEMESWALQAHRAYKTLRHLFFDHSDGIYLSKNYKCSSSDKSETALADISNNNLPFSLLKLIVYLYAAGIKVTIKDELVKLSLATDDDIKSLGKQVSNSGLPKLKNKVVGKGNISKKKKPAIEIHKGSLFSPEIFGQYQCDCGRVKIVRSTGQYRLFFCENEECQRFACPESETWHKFGYIKLPKEIPHPLFKGPVAKQLKISCVPVLPLLFRQLRVNSGDDELQFNTNPNDKNFRINTAYSDLIKASRNKCPIEAIKPLVSNLFEALLAELSGKKKLIRNHLLGKRVDYSARAVIVPDPDLQLDMAIIPEKILNEIYKGRLKNGRLECDDWVLLNRAPTLHKFNMLAFNIRRNPIVDKEDKVIKINPLLCGGFNADFDGDTMAAYFNFPPRLNREMQRMAPSANLRSYKDGKIQLHFTQDILAGLYLMSCEYGEDGGNRLREWLEKNIGIKDEILDQIEYPIKKKNVGQLLEVIAQGQEKHSKAVQKLAREAFNEVTRRGLTFSLLELPNWNQDEFDELRMLFSSVSHKFSRYEFNDDNKMDPGELLEAIRKDLSDNGVSGYEDEVTALNKILSNDRILDSLIEAGKIKTDEHSDLNKTNQEPEKASYIPDMESNARGIGEQSRLLIEIAYPRKCPKLSDKFQNYLKVGTQIRLAGLDGSSEFSMGDFKNGMTPRSLVEVIREDLGDYLFPEHQEDIKWLNEILEKDDWLGILREKKSVDIDQRKDLQQVVEECEKPDFNKNSESGKGAIRKRNRLFLETAYPRECPKSRESGLVVMYHSGSRGDIDDVAAIYLARGCLGGIGKDDSHLVFHSLYSGLQGEEMLYSAKGARRGLTDKKLNTAPAGELTRWMAEALYEYKITKNDCGCSSNESLELVLNKDNKHLIPTIRGKKLAKDCELLGSNAGKWDIVKAGSIIEKTICDRIENSIKQRNNIRVDFYSPIRCLETDGVCKKCYGLSPLKLNLPETEVRDPDIGERVGLIAAQTIGERGTQLTMRTFHTGGTGQEEINMASLRSDLNTTTDDPLEQSISDYFKEFADKFFRSKAYKDVAIVHLELLIGARMIEGDTGAIRKLKNVPFFEKDLIRQITYTDIKRNIIEAAKNGAESDLKALKAKMLFLKGGE